jgi:predicted DNA-binding transcriptional regulator AlpA
MTKEKFISLKEAAELSGYSADYVGQLIRQGKLPGKQVFSNVAWMTTREALDEYIRKGTRTSEPATKFSNIREKVLSSRTLASVFRAVVWIAIAIFAAFILLLFYILSVTIDHRINQQYLDKIEHAQQ